MSNQLELSELKRTWIDNAIIQLQNAHIVRFCADDLHKILDAPPHENWFGCMVAKLRCQGRIKEVGRVRSNRPERNGSKISLWEVV